MEGIMLDIRKQLFTIVNYHNPNNVKYILANYLIYKYKGEGTLSINKVTDNTSISKTSIIKFCKSLGYVSWRQFIAELQNSYERDKIDFEITKMATKMAHANNFNFKKQKDSFLKVWEEYDMLNGKEVLFQCIKFIEKAETILLFGAVDEISLFTNLQSQLLHQEKKLVFPQNTKIEYFKMQLKDLNKKTLVIYVSSSSKWNEVKEKETMKGGTNYINELLNSNAEIIFIGQAKTSGHKKEVYEIAIPFSLNKNISKITLFKFIIELEEMYAYLH